MVPHFNDKPVVNVYSQACSDCSEAYSYKITVIESVPQKQHSKFLNVKASDIYQTILDSVATGRINLYDVEFAVALRNYGYDLSKYFKNPSVPVMVKGDENSENGTISSYEPIKELKNGFNNKAF